MASRVFSLLLLLCMLWGLPVIAGEKSDWQVYHAASFDVSYPSNFTVKPSLKSILSTSRYDSVFFVSPDGKVKFYATTNTADKAPDITIKPAAEIMVSTRTEKQDATGEQDEEYELYRYTWQTIRANNGNYTRSLVIVSDARDGRKYDQGVIGIQYADNASYQKYRDAYMRFKDSLTSRIYYGGSLSVIYPAGFTIRPSLRSGNTRDGAVVSVFFTSPDNTVELYAFSPWPPPENATDCQLLPKTEVLISSTTKEERTSYFPEPCTVTRHTIQAKDGSYTRLVLEIREKDGSALDQVTFGFKYHDQQTYARCAEDYQVLQKSLTLYHWD